MLKTFNDASGEPYKMNSSKQKRQIASQQSTAL